MLIRPGAIGDFLVSVPALEALRGDYTEVWTTSANKSLVRFADRVESIASTGIERVGLTGEPVTGPPRDRLAAFGRIVSWYGSNRPEFREAMQGLPFEFHPALPGEGADRHAVDFYLQQVGAPLGAVPRLPVERRHEGFLVIHPFSGSRRKNWPLDNFRAVATACGYPVRWTAGPEEPLDEAVRFDDLWDLAQWLAGATAYLGNDSGITHLAAAVGVPVIAIFGPSNPEIWAPRGPHVHVLRSPEVDEVLQALQPHLRR